MIKTTVVEGKSDFSARHKAVYLPTVTVH